MLNSNIRCIEIVGKRSDNADMIELNSNIRCIEICLRSLSRLLLFPLNSNIRCIEINKDGVFLIRGGC